MTNKDMLDIAKEEMIQMIARHHDDRCEAAKALALLIMAENKNYIELNTHNACCNETNGYKKGVEYSSSIQHIIDTANSRG